ncbi:MAG: hypothetical protein V2A73_22980 [Pseudomonadota bacterium]
MSRRSNQTKTDDIAVAVIERLFCDPPLNEADLKQRLAAVVPKEARRVLVDRLVRGVETEQDGDLLLAAFDLLGLGKEDARVVGVVTDRSRDQRTRACALTILSEGDPEKLESLLANLSPNEAAEIGELPLIDLLSGIQADHERADELVVAAEVLPEEAQGLFFERMEHHRRKLGTPAAVAYQPLLSSKRCTAIHDQIVGVLVEEATADAIGLIDELCHRTKTDAQRRKLQGSLIRARTRMIAPDRSPPAGFAFVGSCDGQGAFPVCGGFENPDGSLTIASLHIRAAADVRDGFVLPCSSVALLEKMANELSSECQHRLARVSLVQAAALVAMAVNRTNAQGLRLPADAEAAVLLFQRACDPLYSIGETPLVNGQGVTEKALESLLARPEYQSWFFDRGDLEGNGVLLPRPRAKGTAWIAKASTRLDTPSIRRRVVAMAQQAALVHVWLGEDANAALLVAAAAQVEKSFAKSSLVHAMLARSVAAKPQRRPSVLPVLGDADVRRFVKDRFFHDVRVPRGRDLARLDLTEAAFAFLDAAFSSLPGERRPREEEWQRAAYAMGTALADFFLATREVSVDRLDSVLSQALAGSCRLSAKERKIVLAEVVPALGYFVEHVCMKCPVFCLAQPSTRLPAVFFAQEHPALAKQRPSIRRPRQSTRSRDKQ